MDNKTKCQEFLGGMGFMLNSNETYTKHYQSGSITAITDAEFNIFKLILTADSRAQTIFLNMEIEFAVIPKECKGDILSIAAKYSRRQPQNEVYIIYEDCAKCSKKVHSFIKNVAKESICMECI